MVGLTNFEKSMKKNHFNYIICGGGASGLMLAYRLCNDKFFANKTILLIEKENKVLNSDTHQEVLKKLKLNYQKKYQSFFYLYESFRYQNQNIELTTIFRTFMSAK